jgi:hypothetical protein
MQLKMRAFQTIAHSRTLVQQMKGLRRQQKELRRELRELRAEARKLANAQMNARPIEFKLLAA